jgi:hypothetical protein
MTLKFTKLKLKLLEPWMQIPWQFACWLSEKLSEQHICSITIDGVGLSSHGVADLQAAELSIELSRTDVCQFTLHGFFSRVVQMSAILDIKCHV